jgi:hypothetical protein
MKTPKTPANGYYPLILHGSRPSIKNPFSFASKICFNKTEKTAIGSARMKTGFKLPKNDLRFTRRAGYLWLLGIFLTVIPAFASQPIVTSDLTFCPLQKAWVKRGGISAKPPDPLKNICVSDVSKRGFSYESFRRFGTSFDHSRAEELFFSYSKIGRRAFDAVRSEPVPEKDLSGNAFSEKSAANAQTVADKKNAAFIDIDLPLVAVVLTVQKSPRRPDIAESKNLLRKSRPRAPPVSL